MDQFKHSDSLAMPRLDVFNTLQSMMYGNISKLLRGIYNMDSLKIICGNSELGLLEESDFLVSYANSYISVAPGIATNDLESLICIDTALTYSSVMANGAYYVYVKYKQNKALTGREVMLPTKGNLNTDNLYTMLTDSAEIGVASSVPTGGIPLAIVVIYSNVVPSNSSYGTLTRDLCMDEDSGALPRTGGSAIPSWGLSHRVAKIDNEYIEVDGSGNIVTRGYLDTIVEHHYSGASVSMLSIIDLRQQSLLTMRGSDAIEKATARGVSIVNGGLYRSLCTRNVRRHSSTASIASSTPPVLWENRSGAMNMVTDRVKNVYYGVQSSSVNISNNKAIIQDIRSRMMGADETERAALAIEMRRAQQDLILSHNTQQEALSAISTDEISGYMKSTPNIFNYVVEITHSTTIDDGIIMYEAEVVRSPVSSMAGNNSASPPDRYYSEMIRPIGYDIKGDAIYPDRHVSERIYIKVPISLGERVSVKVRPINENNVYGTYSNILTYEFARFDDNEYASYQMIYDIIVPDIISSAATLREYVNYIKELWEQMSTSNEQMRAYQTDIANMKQAISTLQAKVLLLEPIAPHVSQLVLASTNVITPQAT